MKIKGNKYQAARLARIVVSSLVAVAVFAAVAFGYDLWLSRWQLVPAILAGASLWAVLWLVVTAVAGRVYCSSVCPMGTLFDVFARLGHRNKGYFYSSPRVVIRRSLALIAVGALIAGIPLMFDILEPAAAFSRIAAWSLGPVLNAVAFSFGACVVAFATVAFAAAIAFARGRLLCNTICPVGTLLGEISRFSLYHIDINTDKCIGCGKCTERCKAECINPSAHTVDPARCVMCFDCVAACPNSAITYRRGRHRLAMPLMQAAGPSSSSVADIDSCGKPEPDGARRLSRRQFLASVFATAPLALIADDRVDTDLEPLNAVYPPGLFSLNDLRIKCTACGACSTVCPSGIIRPAGSIRSLRTPLRPVLEFDSGFCLYDCTKCTEICPTSALSPLTVSEKHLFVIGRARVVPRLCIEYNTGEGCGICARRCPRRAIVINPVEQPSADTSHAADRPELTPSGRVRRLPFVDLDQCIGCGECRYVCPARPRAFIIEGEE